MRSVGVDLGGRRIGIAVSDPTGTVARPLETLAHRGVSQAVGDVAALVRRLADEDGVEAVVVGLPRHLDGTPSEQTASALAFAEALRAAVPVPVVLQDERLTSREAESRLAELEPDWRRRKARLDQAAAAVILQDYLDARPRPDEPTS